MFALILLFCNICLEVADMCSDVVNYLHGEVHGDTTFDLHGDPHAILSSSLIEVFLLLAVFFAFGVHFNFETEAFTGWLFGIQDAAEPATPPPLPPYSGPATPLVYSSPVEFPFEHFRATGESFAPSHRLFHEDWVRILPPILYKPPCSSDRSVAKMNPSQSSNVSPLAQPRIEEDSVKNQVSIHEAIQPPSQPQPVAPPSSRIDTIMVSPLSHNLIPLQAPLPPPLPPPSSPETILRNALNLVAQEEHKIQEQMVIFLSTITTGAGYESAAALILYFLHEAMQYLSPFFPTGLGLIALDHRPWKQSIVTFWETLSPYGWDFLHHPDIRMPELIRRFHDAAVWFGLEGLLVEFQFNAPPLPEPVPEPAEVEPQVREQPSLDQISPSSAVIVETPQFILHTSEEAMAVAIAEPSPVTEVEPTPRPSPKQPAQQPDPAPGAFMFTMTPVPSSFTFQKGNRTSRPSSRTPGTPKSPSKPKPAQPDASDLLKFDDPDLHNLPTDQLNALTWASFSWSSPTQAAQKIWSHSMQGRLVLPYKKKEVLRTDYVKSLFEGLAADFKRASIILRLQARNCQRPCEDDVAMAPLFGEVQRMIEQAVDLTDKCNELAVWDTQSEWYNACVFFRDLVRLDKEVWETLCAWYGPEKYRPLRAAWKRGITEWLMLDK